MTLIDSRRWMAEGTALFLATAGRLTDEEYAAPSGLPGWSRRHVAAHVAANANAIGNLVHWAATGEPTPMYPSRAERDAGIERGAALPTAEIADWLRRSADALGAAMDALTEDQWRAEVVTGQGATVHATTTPWMRAREVCIHAVDLAAGVGFADLPEGFNGALCEDLRAQRGLDVLPIDLDDAPRAQIAAWLTGRPHTLAGAPELGPWL